MQISEIFNAAVKLPTPARSAFLDGACGADPRLRNEVESLLRAHEDPGNFLNGPAERTTDFEPISEKPGLAIGPYMLREQIGEGGFGLVFVAEQQQPVRRKVALKVIKPGMDTREVVARFEAERQALAMMDHPNIAKVHDAGATDTGRPYFVMELVKGVPITEYADTNNLPPRQRLELFLQVCQAVQHAHQKGVIHRDLKPSNILVAPHDGVPVVKVIDFGVAKALGQQLTEKTVYTKFAAMIGTPLYMSPEQAEVNQLDVDTRSDIYSLGVLLYELLTGTTPFDQKRFATAAFDEIRRIIKEEDPPRPSTRLTSLGATLTTAAARRGTEPGKLAGVVRGELDWIVMKCLEKDRARRYETATGLAKDVQRYLTGDAVEACPPTLGYRLRKAYKRNRAAVLVGGTIATVLLLATGVSLAFGIAAKRAEHQAARSAEDAKANQELARRERDEANAARLALETEQNSRARSDYGWSIQSAQAAWQQHQFEATRGFLDRTRPGMRGWEWHYLNRLCRSDELYTLPTAHETVVSASFSRDGRWIVTNSFSADAQSNGRWLHSIQIWDTATRQPYTLCSDVPRCRTAEFSPDGRLLLIAELNKVTLWDLTTRIAHAPVVIDPDDRFFTAAFSPDGKTIVIAGATIARADDEVETIALWDVKTRKFLWSHKKRNTSCFVPSFGADGRWILAHEQIKDPVDPSKQKRVLKVWDAGTGEELPPLGSDTDIYLGGAFSPDGSRLVTTGLDSIPKVWRIRRDGNRPVLDGEPFLLRGHSGRVRPRAFSPDGTRIVTVGDDGTARIWNAATGAELRVLAGHKQGQDFGDADISHDGRYVLTAGGGAVKVWEVQVADPQVAIANAGLMYGAAPSPTGDRLLTFDNSETKVWDARTWKPLHTLSGGFACWSPDGRRIATRNWGTKLNVYNAENGERLREIKAIVIDYNLRFNADGSRILVTGDDRDVTVWDINTGQKWVLVEPGKSGYRGAGYSPDGKTIFIERQGEHDKTLTGISILDAETHKPILELETGTLKAGTFEPKWWCGTFSRDGRLFLGHFHFDDSSRNECGIWDATTGKLLRPPFPTHAESVVSLELSPDGSRILTAGLNAKLHIIDAKTGDELLVVPMGNLHTATFDRSGHKIIVAASDKVRILDGTPLPELNK